MKIFFVSSEVVPFAKTGGLADVAGALPKALQGHAAVAARPRIVVPRSGRRFLRVLRRALWGLGLLILAGRRGRSGRRQIHHKRPACAAHDAAKVQHGERPVMGRGNRDHHVGAQIND